MALLDSIKDPNTGKIKMPILISLVGAGGLVLYLVMKGGSGSSTTTSAGQSSALTPDLTGLQAAIDAMASGNSGNTSGGGSSTGASVDPPVVDNSGATDYVPPINTSGYTGGGSTDIPIDPSTPTTITDPNSYPVTTPSPFNLPITQQPSVAQLPGSSGSAGGGGSGTGQVIQPIAKSSTVYGGVTAAATAASVAATSILNSRSLTAQTSPSALDLKIAAVAAAHPGATQSAILATAKKDLATQTGATVKANTNTLSKAISAVNTFPANTVTPLNVITPTVFVKAKPNTAKSTPGGTKL